MEEDYNELQTVNRAIVRQVDQEATRQRKNLMLWYETELANANMATEYKSLEAFSKSDWNTTATSSTATGMTAATEAGLGSIYSLASVSETSQYFLDLKTEGIKLSETLRDSARDAEKLALDAINKHLDSKTTVGRLTKELTAKNVSKGKLPKYLDELAEEAKKAGGNTAKMRRMIANAEKRISELAQNGAPTKELQKAYNDVLKQVKKGDIANLNASLTNALNKKAVYNNSRISRTELSKAYSMGFDRQLQDHPLGDNAFVGVQLSSRHVITDVCDYVTGADLHNRGAGVYPQGDAPMLPLHANCLCQYYIVAVRDIDGRKTKFSEKNSDAYLNKLSEQERKMVERSNKNTTVKKLKPLPKKLVKQTELEI